MIFYQNLSCFRWYVIADESSEVKSGKKTLWLVLTNLTTTTHAKSKPIQLYSCNIMTSCMPLITADIDYTDFFNRDVVIKMRMLHNVKIDYAGYYANITYAFSVVNLVIITKCP